MEEKRVEFMEEQNAKMQEAHGKEYTTLCKVKLLAEKIKTDAEEKDASEALLNDICLLADIILDMVNKTLPEVEV